MDQPTLSIADGVSNKSQGNSVNRRIVLRCRPAGVPSAANFRLEERAVPGPSAGQVASALRASRISRSGGRSPMDLWRLWWGNI